MIFVDILAVKKLPHPDAEIVEYAENFDLQSIVTPVKGRKLAKMLRDAGYDKGKVKFIEKGFTEGFDIGYEGPTNRQSQSDNIPLRVGSPTELWNKLIKEVSLKRVVGPFKTIPFENYIQSPIGLVPKAGSEDNKTRLIFHLSFEFGKEQNQLLMNGCTPKDKCTVNYNDLDHAVKLCLLLRKEMDRQGLTDQPIYFGKTDVRSAFRLAPLSPKSWAWLVMKAVNPDSGEVFYFVDKCLPFGASISCAIFQEILDVLKFLVEHRTLTRKQLSNYLDDFLFLARTIAKCNYLISAFLTLCEEVGVPISDDKTEWGTTLIVFLGILLNGCKLTLAVPEEKRIRAINLLKYFIGKNKATVRELQKLCGYLNFLNKAIYPGRVFVRRMYSKYSKWVNLTPIALNEVRVHSFKPKHYHHVRLDKEFKADCQVWLQFLEYPDLRAVVCRPMIDIGEGHSAQEINFCSDASASKKLGFGCYLNKNWLYSKWSPAFIETHKPSIEYLELYALTAEILTWQDFSELNNTRITVFCDNTAVVTMINNITSSCKNCMYLLRILVLNGLIHNRRLFAKYIKTKENEIADSLSRIQLTRFRRIAPNMNAEPDWISDVIWPVEKVWIH